MATIAERTTTTVVFIGDSITDVGRGDDPEGLGNGYVRVIADRLAAVAPSVTVINRGISGDRAKDLVARVDADCVALRPDVVSVLVGINDTWRRYDSDDPTSLAEFVANYRAFLRRIRAESSARLVLLEPFVLPVDGRGSYRVDLDPKIAAVRSLAAEFDASLVRLDGRMTAHAQIVGPSAVAADGVHPTPYGHRVLADAWLAEVSSLLPLIPAEWRLSGFGDEIDEDPAIQTSVLAGLGASAIEVRSAWGVNVVDLDSAQLALLRDTIDAHGLAVSAIASPIGKARLDCVDTEADRLRSAIRAAKTLGTDRIRVFSFFPTDEWNPDADEDAVVAGMTTLSEIARSAGVTLLLENEKHIFGDVPARILRLISRVDSPALRLAWDAANYVQVGSIPDEHMIDLLMPWVDYLQVKDAVALDGTVVPAGRGQGGVPLVVDALLRRGYRGVASLEPHLAAGFSTGGFSGPVAFGLAARSFAAIADERGVTLR